MSKKKETIDYFATYNNKKIMYIGPTYWGKMLYSTKSKLDNMVIHLGLNYLHKNIWNFFINWGIINKHHILKQTNYAYSEKIDAIENAWQYQIENK